MTVDNFGTEPISQIDPSLIAYGEGEDRSEVIPGVDDTEPDYQERSALRRITALAIKPVFVIGRVTNRVSLRTADGIQSVSAGLGIETISSDRTERQKKPQ